MSKTVGTVPSIHGPEDTTECTLQCKDDTAVRWYICRSRYWAVCKNTDFVDAVPSMFGLSNVVWYHDTVFVLSDTSTETTVNGSAGTNVEKRWITFLDEYEEVDAPGVEWNR